MVLPKSKNAVGLGNSLMNDRFGKGKGSDRKKVSTGIQRTDPSGQTYVTNDKKEAAWVKMRSITEQGALDEFLSTAELADTDFTAEKMNNIKIIHTDQKNPYLLSAVEERSAIKKQMARRNRLTVPRRPAWNEKMTTQQLEKQEKESLLEWRRSLADLQENEDLLMTPFERNLEVWRQLWRVVERSDLVVQIVDARNPLLFRSEDLERYVKEVDQRKRNLLLVNKADMMSSGQRQAWARHFRTAGINFRFFSAFLAREVNERVVDEDDLESQHLQTQGPTSEDSAVASEGVASSDEEQGTEIITVDELEQLFLENTPEPLDGDHQKQPKATIGLVGYPNVGKSSTINALIGAKKVSVSSTPGKTKHFQTIHLSDKVILCDCPGLVFPNFATTRAELVCNGILPIDQLREFTGPASLVAQRIPQTFLEAVYGLTIHTRPLEEGGTGIPTAEELLTSYAIARGFATTGQGQPDQSRAARHVLKDYVNGKLLFCQPPPTEASDPQGFNRELYDLSHLPSKRRAMLSVDAQAALSGPKSQSLMDSEQSIASLPVRGTKSNRLDTKFFAPNRTNGGHVSSPFQYTQATQGSRQLSGRKLKTMQALENGVDSADTRKTNSKKHFKGDRRKNRPSEVEE